MAHEHFWFGGMWFFPFFFLLAIAVFGYLVLRLLGNRRSSNGGELGSERSHTPMGVLEMRYAKGEISREEFEQIRKDICG